MAKVSFSNPGTQSLAAVPTAPVTPTQAPVIDVVATVQPVTPTEVVPVVPTQAVAAVAPVTATASTPEASAGPTGTTGSPGPAVITVTPTGSNTAVAVVPPVAPPATSGGFHDDDSVIDAGDLVLPHLNIVQKVGDLSNLFTPGTILLNSNLVLVDAPKPNADSAPVRILVVGWKEKLFIEKLPFGTKGGRIFKAEKQVVDAGGTLDYNESKATGKQLYQRSLTGLILVEQPAGLDATAFPNEFNGKNYALALYTMKGTSYTTGAKPILSARKVGHCREGLRAGWWTIQSKLKSTEGNFYFGPVLRPQEKSDPALRAWLTDLLGF